MALVAPVFFALAAFILVASLALHARYQMLEMSHVAVAQCSSLKASSASAVAACVDQQVQALRSSFTPVCALVSPAPEVQPLTALITGAGLRIWTVTQRMSCSFSLNVPALRLVGFAQPSITVAASSTSPFLPAN